MKNGIQTPRLLIRRFEESDLEDYLAYQTHPVVQEYMPSEPMDEEDALKFLSSQFDAGENEKGRYHAFAVYHCGDNRLIGDVGFYLEPGPEDKGDLGFQFHPDYHGKGYATEAIEGLLKYAFSSLTLQRITSHCDARNFASVRLLERLGMRREGHFKQSRMTKGVFHDEYAYALLREEWISRKA